MLRGRRRRRRRGPGRAALAGLLAWVLALVGLRATTALPEACPPVDATEVTTAAAAAVGWFDRNQHPDGTWLYLYLPAGHTRPADYNLVRHGGVTMSLYQAATAGLEPALEIADRGLAHARDHLVDTGRGRGFGRDGEQVSSGAAALLLAGLAERRALTADPAHDDLMVDLGRFLVGQVEPRGAVLSDWDPDTGRPVPDRYSIYFTGEVLWALSRMHVQFPEQGWDEPALRIARYVATQRDDVENPFPPLPDHWAAYGFSEIGRWESHRLGPDLRTYTRRLAGLLGSQQRFQAKAGDHPVGRLTGGPGRGAALGTTGEGLGALWRLARTDPGLTDLVPTLADRTLCTAAILTRRQGRVDPDDPDVRAGDPGAVRGAWFADGETRMDDQQHALSALLAAREVLLAGYDTTTEIDDG